LLADTVHNLGDALTAVPLWLAFRLSRRPPSRVFTYGLGRAEDLAGLTVVLLMLFSALYAMYESVDRLMHPQSVTHLAAIAGAAIVGFAGNEIVAVLRIRTGREIGSAALVADGYHARTDGITSLAVLAGATGVWLGFDLADPLIGLGISVVILRIVWLSARSVVTRALDGVEPDVVMEISHQAGHVPGVREVTNVRARWAGHRLQAEISVTVPANLTTDDAHKVALEVRHRLLHDIPHLGEAVVHVDPETASGARHHRIDSHAHDGLPLHAHQ
jgi:cation diffusion facilitator family transporter